MKTKVIIDHELYGERSEFASLEDAQQGLRDCGPDFAQVTLTQRADGVVLNERGDVVGIEDRAIQIETSPAVRRLNQAIEQADQLSGYRFDRCGTDELIHWLTANNRFGMATELHMAMRAVYCEEQVLTENSNLS